MLYWTAEHGYQAKVQLSIIPSKGHDPGRTWLLAGPVLVMLLLATLLAWGPNRLHFRLNLSITRLADPREHFNGFPTPYLQRIGAG